MKEIIKVITTIIFFVSMIVLIPAFYQDVDSYLSTQKANTYKVYFNTEEVLLTAVSESAYGLYTNFGSYTLPKEKVVMVEEEIDPYIVYQSLEPKTVQDLLRSQEFEALYVSQSAKEEFTIE